MTFAISMGKRRRRSRNAMRTATIFMSVLAAVAGTLLGSASAQASADKDYDQVLQNVTLDVELAVDTQNFAALEKSAEHYRTTKSRVPGGQWTLFWYYEAFPRVLYGGKKSPSQSEVAKTLDLWTKFAEAWIAKYPESPTPYIAHAAVLKDYAWYRRGHNYAHEVWKDDMDVFHEYLEKADEILDKGKPVAARDPHWYAVKLEVMQGLGGPIEAMMAIGKEAASKEAYYYPVYGTIMVSLAPRWYGSYEQMDTWANFVVGLTKEQDGLSAYARLYWKAYADFGGDFMRLSAVDTKQLVRATKDLLERQPALINYWRVLTMACGTKDGAWAREQWATSMLKFNARASTSIDPRSGCGWALMGDTPGNPDVLPVPSQPPGATSQKANSAEAWHSKP